MLQDFDKGVCQRHACVYEARRPSGGVGQTDNTHSWCCDPERIAREEKKREREREEKKNKIWAIKLYMAPHGFMVLITKFEV